MKNIKFNFLLTRKARTLSKMLGVAALTMSLILGTLLAVRAADGDLDPTFSSDGIVTTPIGSGDDYGSAMAVQSDGKIVVAGDSWNGSNRDFVVVRYNSDGSPDTTFDSDGIVTTPIGSGDDYGKAVAVQSDGKIVVAGYSHNGSNYDVAVVRYTITGTLDTTFDSDGIVTTPIGSDGYGNAVAVQNDGKIVVAGGSVSGGSIDFAVVRYNSDGSLDTTFDADGIVTTSIGSGFDLGNAIAVQGDGKIVVAGSSWNVSNYDVAVVRYNSDGSPDTTFDSDGIVTTPIGSGGNGFDVAMQSDGKIVVAGIGHNGSNYDVAVVRYNNDGNLDTTFDSDGIVTTPIGSNDYGYGAAVQSDGKIVVGGSSWNGSNYDVAVVRYNSDGSLDTTFDADGIVTTPIGSGSDEAQAMAVQNDGKIVVAGYSKNGSNYDVAVVRYLSPSSEIDIQGNGQSITNGDTTPATGDDTDFGSSGTPVTHTFTISNSGTADLILNGTPAVTLTTGTQFSVTTQPSTTIISNTTTTFAITFAPSAIGTFTDTVNIASNDANETPYTFVISGTGTNTPPVITSDGGGAAAVVSVDENQTAVTTVTATDVDGDSVTYAITGGADQSLFGIAPDSGVLTFNSAPDFENPTDSDANNTYIVEVTAMDNGINNLTDVQTITIAVQDVNESFFIFIPMILNN